MIDDMQILLDAIKDMENGALYAFTIFVVYRLAIWAGTAALVYKLGSPVVNGVSVWFSKLSDKPDVVRQVALEKRVITKNDNIGYLHDAVNTAIRHMNDVKGYNSEYLHEDGCKFIWEAVRSAVDNSKTQEKDNA